MGIRSISEIITGRSLARIGPDDSLRSACDRLSDAEADALAVISGGRLVGILSARELNRHGLSEDRRLAETRVAEIMTAAPVAIAPEASLAEAMRVMIARRLRHLPVVGDGTVLALLSMRDFPAEYRLMAERYEEYLPAESGRPLVAG